MQVGKITGLEFAVGYSCSFPVKRCFVQLQARFLNRQEDQANYPTGVIQMMEDSEDCIQHYKYKVNSKLN